MLKYLLQSVLTYKEIEVEIDPVLAGELKNHSSRFQSCGNHRVTFSLFDLITSIGTITTRISKPSLRSKFDVNSELFSWLENDLEFKIKIALDDPEAKKEVSEDFGIGLAAVITDKLFGIKSNTLAKINVYGKRPDFQCSTKLNKFMVIEGKGTLSKYKRVTQIKRAQEQKVTRPADIKIVSSSLLKTSVISHVKYLDPSVIPPDDPEYMKRILMAHHYSQAFNYIGQRDLSLYFSLMAKRIMKDKNFRQYSTKEKMFEDIKTEYLKVNLNGYTFLGRVDLLEEGRYIFSGFDERLLYLAGFLDFEEYPEPYIFRSEDNQFNVFRDGICLGFIDDLSKLPSDLVSAIQSQIMAGRVKNYQEYTTIEDIDGMDGLAFSNFFAYILKIIGFKLSSIENRDELHGDFFLKYKNKPIIIEVKKVSRYISRSTIENLIQKNKDYKLILVTNGNLTKQVYDFINHKDLTIIGRNELIEIIKDKKHLAKIFERIVTE